MPRRDDVLLGDLLDSTLAVKKYLTRGGTRWLEDPALADAVLLHLVRIGEIARTVSSALQSAHPEVPWARMRGFRNVAVHEYFRLEMLLVRGVAEDEVPALHGLVLDVLRAEFPDVADSYEQRG